MSSQSTQPPAPPVAATATAVAAAPKFEDALARLTEIVQSLERGDLSLEDSLRLFEEGVKLSRLAQEKLDLAQKKVERLLSVDEQGKPRTQPFETTASDDE
jgi:exodeoxyribonuclease VII small subunit